MLFSRTLLQGQHPYTLHNTEARDLYSSNISVFVFKNVIIVTKSIGNVLQSDMASVECLTGSLL